MGRRSMDERMVIFNEELVILQFFSGQKNFCRKIRRNPEESNIQSAENENL